MTDKQKHFLVGSAFGLSALPLSFYIPITWVVGTTFIFASGVFIGKELHDIPTTGFDKVDILADYLGLIAGYIIAFFTYGIINIIRL